MCDYFVFGIDETPWWFKQTKYIIPGTFFVSDTKGMTHEFVDYDKFSERYEIIHHITENECIESHPATSVAGMPYVDSGGVPSQYCDVNKCGECTSKKLPDDTVFEYIIYNINSSIPKPCYISTKTFPSFF